MKLSLRLHIAFVVAALVVPVAAQAEGVVYLKGGLAQLADNSQTLGGLARTLDTNSTDTYGMLFEYRIRRDIALGVEYLSYRNKFLPPDSATDTGVATTRSLQFVAKKYLGHRVVHPFFGLGLGAASTKVDYGPGTSTNRDTGFAVQATLGFELRFDEMGLMFEAKRMVYDMSGEHSDYNPSAAGLFAGIGFNW